MTYEDNTVLTVTVDKNGVKDNHLFVLLPDGSKGYIPVKEMPGSHREEQTEWLRSVSKQVAAGEQVRFRAAVIDCLSAPKITLSVRRGMRLDIMGKLEVGTPISTEIKTVVAGKWFAIVEYSFEGYTGDGILPMSQLAGETRAQREARFGTLEVGQKLELSVFQVDAAANSIKFSELALKARQIDLDRRAVLEKALVSGTPHIFTAIITKVTDTGAQLQVFVPTFRSPEKGFIANADVTRTNILKVGQTIKVLPLRFEGEIVHVQHRSVANVKIGSRQPIQVAKPSAGVEGNIEEAELAANQAFLKGDKDTLQKLLNKRF